jgi:hypothetical protein
MRAGHPLFLAIFLLVLAPVAAAVIIAVLLLFGVQPHLVFAPGHALLAFLRSRGLHPPNAIGVLTTVACWWLPIAAIGIAWDRRRK